MSIKKWSNKMIVNRNKKKHDTKMKTGFSKCSKLTRAISHKLLKKTSSKPSQEKTSNSSVLLISMISNTAANEKKIWVKNENGNSENFFKGNLLQPLDVLIEEARYQLSIEKLREEKMGQFGEERHHSKFSRVQDSDDIYEEMELLETFYENIYDGDYMDMGLVL